MTHISAARLQDIPELVHLMQQNWEFEQNSGFDAARAAKLLEEFLAHPEHGSCWIASDGEGMAQGYMLCCRVFSFQHCGPIAIVDELYVVPAVHRNGIGRALVDAAGTAMRAKGCVLIEMEVSERNFRAQQFYSILGFATRAGYSMMHKRLVG